MSKIEDNIAWSNKKLKIRWRRINPASVTAPVHATPRRHRPSPRHRRRRPQ